MCSVLDLTVQVHSYLTGIRIHISGPENMESMVKKYQQKFKKVKEHMDRWDELQSLLLSQFRNTSSIIQRLQLIQDLKKYGTLKSVDGIEDAVFAKQMHSLQSILFSMNKTMEEFHDVVILIERIARDGRQLVKGGSVQPKTGQLKQRIGIKPSLVDCVEGLTRLHDMHQSEYLLKASIVSALPTIILGSSDSDLEALQQLLVDQPNVPKEEVRFIYDIIFAEDIC